MLITGKRKSLIRILQTHYACSNCGEQKITLYVYARYFHLFWFPMFALKPSVLSECSHCKQVLTYNEMPRQLQQHYQRAKADIKPKLWQFFGSILLGMGILLLFYFANESVKKDKQYLKNPKIGDVYHQRLAFKNYTVVKVVRISTDSVFVTQNTMSVNKFSKINTIDKDENYLSVSNGIAKKELIKMYKNGTIINVVRK